jgi:hypothetical protein
MLVTWALRGIVNGLTMPTCEKESMCHTYLPEEAMNYLQKYIANQNK